jgi:3-methyladenine DNA glycosylase AlkD
MIKENSSEEYAKTLQWFFKTGKGEYGEGDVFIGIRMPKLREIVKRNLDLALNELQILLNSKIHEERLAALITLTYQFPKSDVKQKEKIFKFYLNNTNRINNWDLVDVSCHKIIGAWLLDKNKDVLLKLAKSKNLWEKRIAIVSTYHFIQRHQFDYTLRISEILMKDKHDLIHKGVGWMLRELGKRNIEVEESFLQKHYKQMPRTMLRYAIEKFPEIKRKAYLLGRV